MLLASSFRRFLAKVAATAQTSATPIAKKCTKCRKSEQSNIRANPPADELILENADCKPLSENREICPRNIGQNKQYAKCRVNTL